MSKHLQTKLFLCRMAPLCQLHCFTLFLLRVWERYHYLSMSTELMAEISTWSSDQRKGYSWSRAGLLPTATSGNSSDQVEIVEQELCVEVNLCSLSPLSEGEESWVCPGIDKLVWREGREEWRTSKPVSITFSHQESPLLHSPALQPAVLELCQ